MIGKKHCKAQYKQDVTRSFEFEKEVGIAIKSKETSYYPVRNSYSVAIIYQPALATVGSTICSQMHVQIMHSLAYLQDLITT